MARPIQFHKIPQTSRVAVTLSASELKELRKMAIDLEIPESEVLRLALLMLIRRYHSDPIQAIAEDAASLLSHKE
jgi:hypothetical protein